MKRMLRATLVIVCVALVVGAPAAWAGGKPGNPAIDQYVEQVPTSKGSHAVGAGKSHRVSTLPTSVQHALRDQGGDALVLEKIATTSDYGASKRIKVKKADRARLHKELKQAESEQAKPVRAGFGAVADDGNGRLLTLVIVMGVMTAAALALAVARRRGSGASRR